MKLWTKAIIIGIAIEGVLFSVMQASECGPCGPRDSVGIVVMLAHFPAFMLATPFSWLELPEWTDTPLIFTLACLWWIMISYAFLVTRRRK